MQIGLEFRESHLVLDARTPRVFEEGMTFNLCVGFANVKRNPPGTVS
jgi:nucleosome binding factor SPN SPT16 subunit